MCTLACLPPCCASMIRLTRLPTPLTLLTVAYQDIFLPPLPLVFSYFHTLLPSHPYRRTLTHSFPDTRIHSYPRTHIPSHPHDSHQLLPDTVTPLPSRPPYPLTVILSHPHVLRPSYHHHPHIFGYKTPHHCMHPSLHPVLFFSLLLPLVLVLLVCQYRTPGHAMHAGLPWSSGRWQTDSSLPTSGQISGAGSTVSGGSCGRQVSPAPCGHDALAG